MTDPQTSKSHPPQHLTSTAVGSGPRTGLAFSLVFLLLAVGIFLGGIFYYRTIERRFMAEVEHQLSAVADLKVRQLVRWREERLGDASLLFRNSAFSGLVRRLLEQPQDADARRLLQQWIEKYTRQPDYDQVRLLDARGETLLSAPADLLAPSAVEAREFAGAIRSGATTIQGFYRDEIENKVHLGLLVPIVDAEDDARPFGLLALQIDPEAYLYPAIQQWPTSSPTAETLLVRREGSEVVFLNDLRFRKAAALNLRAPLDLVSLPATLAARGLEGFVEGTDYRGIPVVAAIRSVPDSPWAMVSKVDAAEIFGPLQGQLKGISLLIIVLVLGAGAGVGLIWRQQSIRTLSKEAATAESLRETTDYLENLLDHANAPILVWNPQLEVTRFNHAFEAVTGRSATEILGKPLTSLFPETAKAAARERILGAMQGELLESVEIPIQRTDGEVRSVLWNSATIYATDRRTPIAVIAQGQDITERKEAEAELFRLNADLEQRVQDRTFELEVANKELEAFSYSVSHDLRAPLRAIDGFGRILAEDYKACLDSEGQRVLGVISSETRRMGQLVDDLLGFSRIGRQQLQRAEIDLTALARDCFEERAFRLPERVLQLELGRLPPALGDRALLEVVLGNLLSNAIKFTEPRNPAVIEIGCREIGGESVYFVKDNGVGFDMAYAEKLFGVFQRLHSAAEFEGNGVGLALVQRIVHRHGGRVWAESTIGEGATFFFTLAAKELPDA